MRPTGVDRASRRGTKAKVHLIRPHRTQTVARTGSRLPLRLRVELGRGRAWNRNRPTWATTSLNPRFAPAAAVGTCDYDEPAEAESVDSL